MSTRNGDCDRIGSIGQISHMINAASDPHTARAHIPSRRRARHHQHDHTTPAHDHHADGNGTFTDENGSASTPLTIESNTSAPVESGIASSRATLGMHTASTILVYPRASRTAEIGTTTMLMTIPSTATVPK